MNYEQIMTQKHGGATNSGDSDIPLVDSQNQADKGLMAFLDEMHAKMPDVPEEDVQKDIEEAIAAIRNRPEE